MRRRKPPVYSAPFILVSFVTGLSCRIKMELDHTSFLSRLLYWQRQIETPQCGRSGFLFSDAFSSASINLNFKSTDRKLWNSKGFKCAPPCSRCIFLLSLKILANVSRRFKVKTRLRINACVLVSPLFHLVKEVHSALSHTNDSLFVAFAKVGKAAWNVCGVF